MNFFMEVAKLRAARLLWAELMARFDPKSAEEPGAAHALPDLGLVADRAGRLQQRHPHLHRGDGRDAGPDAEPAHQLARRGARAADRLLGAHRAQHAAAAAARDGHDAAGRPVGRQLLRRAAHARAGAARAQAHIDEVEALGGMAKAIEAGLPKLRIEEAAARTQARIDSGRQTIVGVNRYKPTADRSGARAEGRQRGGARDADRAPAAAAARARHRRGRDARCGADGVRRGPRAATCSSWRSRRRGRGRRSARSRWRSRRCAVATRPRSAPSPACTVEKWARPRTRSTTVRARTAAFLEREGRRPRILVAKMGQDGHDRGQKVIASAFADLGFDVDIGPLFQTPEETAHAAVENDVHVVGASSLAAGHLTLVPALRAALAALGRPDILVVVGGVIPPDDYQPLRDAGAVAIFGPGTVIADAAGDLLDRLEARP